MSARIVVVHAETDFLAEAIAALRQAGFEVEGFSNPHEALDALEAEQDVDLLITGISFGHGKQNGISLALMEKTTRRNLKVLFAASPEYQGQDDGIGEFLPLPSSGVEVAQVVQRVLSEPQTKKTATESKSPSAGRVSNIPTVITPHRRHF